MVLKMGKRHVRSNSVKVSVGFTFSELVGLACLPRADMEIGRWTLLFTL